MALSNPLFDEDIQSNNDDDPPKNEESTDGGELVNDPAQTALSPTETILSSVQKLLECPVCLNRMYPPIHQCSNGHTICSDCKPRVHNRCPTCSHKLGNIRCLALEKVSASFALPCKYLGFRVQAEVSENWPMQEGEAQDAGLSGQAPNWMQGLEDRIFHRIVQRKENKVSIVMEKVNDEIEKMKDKIITTFQAKLKDGITKMVQEMVKDGRVKMVPTKVKD